MYFLSAVFQCEVHMYIYVDSNCMILQVFFHERVATEDYIATYACAHNAGNFIVLQLHSYVHDCSYHVHAGCLCYQLQVDRLCLSICTLEIIRLSGMQNIF